MAKKGPRVHLIAGDVEQEMEAFREVSPDRFHNLGLCKQAIGSLAAGLAIERLGPVIYSITPFVPEGPYEKVKIDIDEQSLPVMLAGYSDYPADESIHWPCNSEITVSTFKNLMNFFTATSDHAKKAMLDTYLMNVPSMIFHKRDGLPNV